MINLKNKFKIETFNKRKIGSFTKSELCVYQPYTLLGAKPTMFILIAAGIHE